MGYLVFYGWDIYYLSEGVVQEKTEKGIESEKGASTNK